MTDAQSAPEVTQADREAAADLIETYWFDADANMIKLAQSYRAGHGQGVFPRAFARHRHEAVQSQGGGEWLPIESAPKDGTRVLLYAPTRAFPTAAIVGWWGASGKSWLSEPGMWQRTPTHWQPLPTPPAITVDRDAGR